MKTKLVLWGTNAQEERVLVALELLPRENKINIYEFPETVATEAFYQQMMNEWRVGQPMEFPEGSFTKSERELTITDSLLPDELKVERGDLVQRAQAEWHFVVLSAKLSDAYQSELAEIRDRIDRLDTFDDEIWNNLKDFWDKVQSQVRERNLFRDHANNLRNKTNELFARMKELRAKLDEQYKETSKKNLDRFMEKLSEIEKKISDGLRFQSIFEELKDLQRKFKKADFTREHRSKVWERIDAAFKTVKERRFGSAGDDKSPVDRLKRRYDGLIAAMGKMKRSIKRDEEELAFQNRRIANTDGQLEAQIRQAKIVMIEERIRSKQEKFKEMERTKAELEKRMETARAKEEKRKEQEKIEEAKRKAQEKIAEEIKEAAEARSEDEQKLEKAAEALSSKKDAGTPEKKEKQEESAQPADQQKAAAGDDSLIDAVGTTMGEVVEDAVDTFKAIAKVVGGQIGEALEDLKEKMDEVKEEVEEEVEEIKEKVKKATASEEEE